MSTQDWWVTSTSVVAADRARVIFWRAGSGSGGSPLTGDLQQHVVGSRLTDRGPDAVPGEWADHQPRLRTRTSELQCRITQVKPYEVPLRVGYLPAGGRQTGTYPLSLCHQLVHSCEQLGFGVEGGDGRILGDLGDAERQRTLARGRII